MSNTKMSKKTFGRDKNTETAEKLLQKGRTAYKAEDYETAAEYFKKAAEQGNVDAQCNLGICYDKGIGVEQDSVEAAKWFRKAAEQGIAASQFNLGVCYMTGEGVQESGSEGIKWLKKAAKQDHVEAQRILRRRGYTW